MTVTLVRFLARAVACLGILGLGGCYAAIDVPDRSDASLPGAGAADGGAVRDAQVLDATISDAALPDATLPDAALPDASVPDAGALDGGGNDAGLIDAGLIDAGLIDAGGLDGGSQGPTEAVAYQINPAHTGSQADDTLVPPLTQRWKVDFPGAVSYALVAGGRVFVTVAHRGYGTDLYALNQASGAVEWGPIDLGGTYWWSGTAYDSGRVFVVNYDGLLQAFDASSGTKAWARPLTGQWSFTSAPTASGGMVFVGGAGFGGTLYAVRASDGAVLWTAAVENGDDSSPALSTTAVYVSYACNQDYAFAPAGEPLWHHSGPCEGGGGSTPVLSGGRLYARDWAAPNIILDAATGDAVGSFSASESPAFDLSLGFFLSSGTLTARSVPDLTSRWTFSGDGMLVTAPIVVSGHVFIGSSSGKLYALEEQSGALAWSTDVGAAFSSSTADATRPWSGLAAAAGALVVSAGDRLAAYW